ncbi:MAG: GNAT family N-acetyltransferase [Bacteroidia bacterium]
MKIKHRDTESGLFYIEENEKYIANLEYINEKENTMVILHTMVSKSLEGKGVGKSLVEAAVKFARKNSMKIKAVCPFARAIIRKDEQYADIMVK